MSSKFDQIASQEALDLLINSGQADEELVTSIKLSNDPRLRRLFRLDDPRVSNEDIRDELIKLDFVWNGGTFLQGYDGSRKFQIKYNPVLKVFVL